MLQWLRNRIEIWKDYPLHDGYVVGGRYRIEHCIGMGSYGITYKVKDLETDKVYLLKQHKPSKGKLGAKLLKKEAKHLNLIQHSNIPSCIHEWEEKGRSFLVMDFIEGFNVEQLLDGGQFSFSELEALEVVKRIAALIADVHRAGLIHMDVRIPNVLIQGEQVYLIDFGLSRQYSEGRANSDQQDNVDSIPPLYAGLNAAENSQGDHFKQRMRRIHPSSDWYALGHFLLFLLYSTYEADEEQEERCWTEELDMHAETKALIQMLLAASDTFDDTVYLVQIEKSYAAIKSSFS
ncbi:serine/threonine protein kinase [Paenibacillus arenosi]|uniref:Protein kinase n=1 Tax=Paenibacillus arenosi TaxID=2774142 RepID=A0ABR9B361_9BACL|nr:protein kinase [Paenibacillus arenosi]MBD8500790.1 protein kinase [Paenibacillus arenosi]